MRVQVESLVFYNVELGVDFKAFEWRERVIKLRHQNQPVDRILKEDVDPLWEP